MAKVNNALVTYTDLTTMALTAKGSPATGNRIATKQFIIDNYYVNESYLSGYTSNQCPPYQNIIGASINGYALAVSNDTNGVLLSSNAGDTWSAIPQFSGRGTYGNTTEVSTTGQYMLVVASSPSELFLSSSYGSSWTAIATISGNVTDLAISDNGQYIVYVIDGASGNVYRSTNFGASFSTSGSPGVSSWKGVAMSSSGQYITLTTYNSYIFVSSDYGASYTGKPLYPATLWVPVAMSKDGRYQMAGRGGSTGTLYRSNDYGSTWSNTGVVLPNGWARIALSGDGRYGLGFCNFDALELYRSTNYGINWSIVTTIGSSGNGNWKCIAIAPDGITQLVGASGTVFPINSMWKSTNYGANFSSVSGTNIGWTAVSLSDGLGTTTTTTTRAPYTYVEIINATSFTDITNVTVNGVALDPGLFPVAPGNFASDLTYQMGTYTVIIFYSGITSNYVSIYDTELNYNCANATGGSRTFGGQITNGTLPNIQIEMGDGTCP
jgi:hypothetical protein